MQAISKNSSGILTLSSANRGTIILNYFYFHRLYDLSQDYLRLFLDYCDYCFAKTLMIICDYCIVSKMTIISLIVFGIYYFDYLYYITIIRIIAIIAIMFFTPTYTLKRYTASDSGFNSRNAFVYIRA